MTRRLAPLVRFTRRLARDRGGLAFMEFAFTLPIMLVLSLTGAELTNFIITRMRVSQIALQLADNAARIGSGSQLAAKTITESDINDLLTGAGLQAGELDLYKHGRVIISDLEPMPNFNITGKYQIKWQRCSGAMTSHKSGYGKAGDKDLDGMGPEGRLTIAPDGGAAMFVEVYYEYQPLIKTSLSPSNEMIETASMLVRDTRDLTQIYNTAGAPVSSC